MSIRMRLVDRATEQEVAVIVAAPPVGGVGDLVAVRAQDCADANPADPRTWRLYDVYKVVYVPADALKTDGGATLDAVVIVHRYAPPEGADPEDVLAQKLLCGGFSAK